MVQSSNEQLDLLSNSIRVVKDAFLPIELGIRNVVKEFETCYNEKIRSNHVGLACEGFDKDRVSKLQIRAVKKSNVDNVDERKKGVSIQVPVGIVLGMFSLRFDNGYKDNGNRKVEVTRNGLKEKEREIGNKGGNTNCLQLVVTWSLLVNGIVRAFSSPFKNIKKGLQKGGEDNRSHLYFCNQEPMPEVLSEKRGSKVFNEGNIDDKEGKNVSIECFVGYVVDQLAVNLLKFDRSLQESDGKDCARDSSTPSLVTSLFFHLRALMSVLENQKVDVNGLLGNLRFARVGDVPSSIVGISSPVNEEGGDEGGSTGSSEETGTISPQKLASGLLTIPLSNVERLKSTLSNVSLAELMELLPQLGRSSKDHPDKKKLFSVQDFFRYTESEGRRFFEELDRDGDGQVTLEDLEIAMRKRKLPQRYAREFMHRAKSHFFSKSFGWKQFLSLMEQKEPTILRAYTSLCLSKSGTLQKSEILASLKNAGLPANEENAVAMMRFLRVDREESISYGHFRNFMLLLPSDRLQDDPRIIWFESATVVAVAPPIEGPAGSVLKSALAGGLASALSCSLLHPVDTIKTRVQASTLSFPEIISKLPQIGVRALYRGSIPAILGQFSSHGLRTGLFEASRIVLVNVAPTLPDIQVQSVASFCSTFLGTAVRIPCEVLKQRLQAGLFNNVGEAIIGTIQQDGLKGFFRGTGATLCREVPFYVAGMGLYAESKKVIQQLLRRELEPWETIVVGALSGGLAAVITTPFDVMKTRTMTARGRPLPMTLVFFSILRREGPIGLFKGAVPRFFWIAPLGAMNFAGYELARKAMDRNEDPTVDQLPQKKLTSSG